MAFDLKTWWHNPALKWYDQHPLAHALGGLVFVAVASFDLLAVRLGQYLTFAALVGIQLLAALPVVRRENQGHSIRLGKVTHPLVTVLGTGLMLAYLLPWSWKAWALATTCQATWEVLQVAAWWDDALGASTYPWESAVLDAATASFAAAVITSLFVI